MNELERLTPQQFELFQEFIYSRCGIKIDLSKITLVSNRIRRRLQPSNCEDFDAYYRFIRSKAGKSELVEFFNAITTNETSFFRTASNFAWLKNEYLPQLLREKSEGKRSPVLRIWSAACSSGEEPYSIAMCLSEEARIVREWDVQIVGTDISETSLGRAREAVYTERTMQELDSNRISKHFSEESSNQYRLRPAIARMVSFSNHNLMEPFPAKPFDCIWIRNVLIYFDRVSKAKVIENLVQSLVSGGYLVVGPSEGIYDMLGMLQKRNTFLYQKQ
ncbi:Chemotaxis protein methyltransferase Cher2 [Pirellula sp. SH-Sr6A]|uniref:CheR family methyltransferase n=1 Tax=Pirellula sp. SH-Sr6A TaxID=1632865 RepID=UPI00078EBC21|nr:protein-glutamate O-methyltransferase CheR [Pirellula sp. SH-Sr6A]AMV35414.1 Chemotaxis protein methyltransferase Cher2 [Pirellula sp. SH-Sr6A]